MAAILFFKATILTTLKLTEIDLKTMKEVEHLLLQCAVHADLNDIMLNNLMNILSQLYVSRHCSSSLRRVVRS